MLYHNLRGVNTTKSASVRRVLLSSATNTTQHTKSITEQTTEHKMWQRGNNSYIIYRKLTDHASYLVAFQYNVLQKITVISVSRYTEENSYLRITYYRCKQICQYNILMRKRICLQSEMHGNQTNNSDIA